MFKKLCRFGVAALMMAGAVGVTSEGGAGPEPKAPAAISSGVNNWLCRPSAAHPEPVVLLHGLGAPAAGHWSFLAPYLASQGYCVFYKTYGQVTPLLPLG